MLSKWSNSCHISPDPSLNLKYGETAAPSLQDLRAQDWAVSGRPLHCFLPSVSPFPAGGSRPGWHQRREGVPGRKGRPRASGIACKYLGAIRLLGGAALGSPSPRLCCWAGTRGGCCSAPKVLSIPVCWVLPCHSGGGMQALSIFPRPSLGAGTM